MSKIELMNSISKKIAELQVLLHTLENTINPTYKPISSRSSDLELQISDTMSSLDMLDQEIYLRLLKTDE